MRFFRIPQIIKMYISQCHPTQKWRSRFLTVQLRKEYTLQKAITPEDGS